MNEVVIALVIFLFGILTDYCWCRATQYATQYKPWRASIYSGLLTAIGLLSYWEVFQAGSFWKGLMYVLGCAVGAYFTSKKPISNNKLKV